MCVCVYDACKLDDWLLYLNISHSPHPRIYTPIYKQEYTHTCVYVCVCVRVLYINICIHSHTDTHTHIPKHSYICTQTHICIPMYTCTDMKTPTHTNTPDYATSTTLTITDRTSHLPRSRSQTAHHYVSLL